MKKLLIFGALLLFASVAIAMYWRAQRLSRELQQARELVGTVQAGKLLEELTRAHPDNAEIQFLQARQLRLQGENDRALTCCQRAADLGYPTSQVSREMLLAKAQKNFSQFEPDLQHLLESNPGDRELVLILALGWSRLGNFSKAEALLNGILERQPEDAAALWVRGRIRLQKHQAHEARPDLEKAVTKGRDRYYYSRARYQLAKCDLELGKFDEALALFQDCRHDEPNNSRVLKQLQR